ncbi:MAG: oligoendopeptidase F [Verrucomicrobiales bacterium]|nr:oligoendopeptidase F [Verrucomicrobiales bacterium]
MKRLLLLSLLFPILTLAQESETPETKAPTVWDLTDLFPSVEDWETALNEVSDGIPVLESYQGKLGESAALLEAALKERSDLSRKLGRVRVYASLKADEDLGEPEPRARKQRVSSVSSELWQSSSWMSPEIIAVGPEKIEAFIAEAPGLAPFDHGLRSTLRHAPHTLTPEVERVLAAAGKLTRQPSQIYSVFANADLPWPTITLSTGEEVYLNQAGYSKYRAVDNRDDRKAVFDAFWGKLGAYQSTMGQVLLSEVEANVFQSEMRDYDNILDWTLSGDNLPEEVYRSLVKVTNESLPTLHRYFKLRERMLGIDDIRYYDVYPDLVESDEVFTIDRSIETTVLGVAGLGEEYGDLLKSYVQIDHTHVFPQKGKRSGAYMSGSAYDTDPYMLLNHNDDYNSMSTYAHEVGHALHTILTKEHQPYEKSGYSTFIAETAAIVNELMLQDYALENAKDDQERLFYLGTALEQLRGTFFRQTMFAEFELAIHEEVEKGAPLTGDRLTQLYGDLLKRYHGHDEGVLTIDDAYCVEWAYIPHFYYDFYVFQYATSISAAAYYTEEIKKNGEPALEKYLNVLKAGGSDDPHEILLEESGLDMTQEAPYRALIRRMESIMDQIELILDQESA